MMNKNIVAVLVIILVAAAGWWYVNYQPNPFPLQGEDSIESWDFQGSHSDGGTNEQKVRDEITRLEAGLEDDATEPTDYALYVSIANQYSLLGDGKSAYKYLGKALGVDAEKTGLAWHNMATLMERLGAYETARTAYDRAIEAQVVVETYHTAYIQFLMKHFSEDRLEIEAAFSRAEKQLGEEYPSLLQLRAEWLEREGKTQEAEEVRKKLQSIISGL